MWNDLIFPDEESATLSNFGIFHLNIDDAAIFVAKCLWSNEGLVMKDFDYYDNLFEDVEVVLEFRKYISKYKNLIVKGIENGNLNSSLLKRDLDEVIIQDKTFVDVAVLAEFLSERSLEIQGNTFEDYTKQQNKLLELAVTTIRFGIRDKYTDLDQHTKDHILYLEERIEELEKDNKLLEQSEMVVLNKPLHTKERETLLKLIIGMAVSGYKFNPKAKRNEATSDIVGDLDENGIALDPDTVRKWLKEASELLPAEFDQ